MNQKLLKVKNGVSNFISKFLDGDFFGLAAEISFYLLTSFFPMIISIFTAASYISLNYTDVLFKIISTLPHQVSDLLIGMFSSPARSTLLIISTAFLSLFTMSGLISTVEKALNRFYNLVNRRSFLTSKLIALFFAVLIYISIIASLGLIVFGSVIGAQIHRLTSDEALLSLWNVSRYTLVFVFIVAVISALYKAMPNVKLKIRGVIPGAVFTTIAWYTSSMLFALYVNNFPQYEIIYGSLAGFVCLVMWIYLTAIALVSGAKINGLLYQHRPDILGKQKKNDTESNAE